jgi:hypothetical protein
MALPADLVEQEAEAAAWRALRGERCPVAPLRDCPEVVPAIPLIIWGLMAAAAGLGLYSTFGRDNDMAEDARRPDKHLHETWWGFVPLVGSVDQVLNGRTALNRFVGTVFLVLDVSMVGAVVKGVALGVRGLAAAGLRTAAKGGGEIAQREAYQKLLQEGVRFGSREEIAKTIAEASARGPIVVAAGEGWLHHSASYLMHNGKIWRIHGGPTMMFLGRRQAARELTQQQIAAMARRMNAMSIYRVDAQVAESAAQWYAKNAGSSAFKMFLRAEGCASTQALLLQQLGRGVAWSGGFRRFAPLLPIFMDGGRMGTAGIHRLASPWISLPRMMTGTGAQVGTWLTLREMMWGPNALYNQIGAMQAQSLGVHALANSTPDDALIGLELEREPDLNGLLLEDDPNPVFPTSGEMMLELPPEALADLFPIETAPPLVTRTFPGGGTMTTSTTAGRLPQAPKVSAEYRESTVCTSGGSGELPIEICQTTRTYRVGSNDNLSLISQRVYGTSTRWQEIYERNKDKIGSDANLIHPGTELDLP